MEWYPGEYSLAKASLRIVDFFLSFLCIFCTSCLCSSPTFGWQKIGKCGLFCLAWQMDRYGAELYSLSDKCRPASLSTWDFFQHCTFIETFRVGFPTLWDFFACHYSSPKKLGNLYTSKVVKGQNFPQLLRDVRIVLPDFAFILMKILKLSKSFHEETQIFFKSSILLQIWMQRWRKGHKMSGSHWA